MILHVLLVAALQAPAAQAFPTIFVARYAKDCTDHPFADFGKVHEYSKTVDKNAVFSLTAPSGKAAGGTVCAGDEYNLHVTFGGLSLRNYLLTSTHGSLAADNNDCDAWCENRVCSKTPVPHGKAVFKLPCDIAAGKQVLLKMTSANGRTPTPGSTLRTNTLSLNVEGPCPGKCGASSSSKGSKGGASSSSSGSSDKGSSGSKGGSSSSSDQGDGAGPETKKVSQKSQGP